MADRERIEVMIENAELKFRNFSGKADKYNREGDRNFAVVLDTDNAEKLAAEGWNVKWLEPRDEGDLPVPYIPVAVRYDKYPPRITIIANGKRTPITEETVELVDQMDILNADVMLNGSRWTMEATGKSGIKAYLQTAFFTIYQDALAAKYAEEDDGEQYHVG